MASSAVDGWVDLPLLLEFGSQITLCFGRSGMPVHVKDLRGRAEEILGGTMAIEAPLHAERFRLVDHAHLIHRTMAAVTTNAAVHMDGMIEIGVVGQAMDLHPGNRLTGIPAVADRGKTRTVRQNLALTMAIDTGLGGRQVGMAGDLDEAVTITAIHSQLLYVKGMGEGNRLVRLVADSGVLGREVIPDPQGDGGADHQAADEQLKRQPIGPSREKIRHSGC